jgi:Rieske Fe-S protein
VHDLAAGPLLVTDPVSGDPAYLVRAGDHVRCLSAVCTHGGCTVAWSAKQHEFACPCHGGLYDIDGAVVSGPPPQPLPELAVRVAHGQVFRRA